MKSLVDYHTRHTHHQGHVCAWFVLEEQVGEPAEIDLHWVGHNELCAVPDGFFHLGGYHWVCRCGIGTNSEHGAAFLYLVDAVGHGS